MNYSKYGKGWFKESRRHSLARLGIKTGRKNYARLGDGPYIPYARESNNHKKLTKQAEKEAIEARMERVGFTKKSSGDGPYIPCKIQYSKIDYSMMSKLQTFLHKKFNRGLEKKPHLEEHPDVITAREEIKDVTNWDNFRGWLKKHKGTVTLIGLGGLAGIVGATAGLPTLMQNIHTGEIVAVGGTLLGRTGMITQTVLTGMGVMSEAKIIGKDTHKELYGSSEIRPGEVEIETPGTDVLVMKVKHKKQISYSENLSEVSSDPIPFSKLTKKERKLLSSSIKKVKSLLGKRGKQISFNERNLQVVKRVGPDDTAFGAHQGDLIQIDRDTLKDKDKTEGVLMHESLHKIFGVKDETRDLENLQIDFMGLAM